MHENGQALQIKAPRCLHPLIAPARNPSRKHGQQEINTPMSMIKNHCRKNVSLCIALAVLSAGAGCRRGNIASDSTEPAGTTVVATAMSQESPNTVEPCDLILAPH